MIVISYSTWVNVLSFFPPECICQLCLVFISKPVPNSDLCWEACTLSNMESLVRRAAKWDQQTGNWKDELQPSSCPNSHYRANAIPVRQFLSPFSVSLCSPVCSSLILPLSLSLSLSLPVRAACRGKSSAEGRSVATQFTLPVEFMLLEHLNSRSNSSECVLTSTPKHIQWKYLACK